MKVDTRNHNKMCIALICGILGCLCMGGGDWLMIYGDPSLQRSCLVILQSPIKLNKTKKVICEGAKPQESPAKVC